MVNKTDHYQKYMEEVHGRIFVPDEIFGEVVKETTGSYPASKEKVLKGEANQVFDVRTEEGLEVIVRVTTHMESFWKEKFAMDKCRKVGVPVAEIFGIKDLKINDKDYSISVLRKIEGDTLERGKINWTKLDSRTKRDILHQAGEYLSLINSIDIEGFGWIHKDGKGHHKYFEDLMLEHTDQEDVHLDLARRNNFNMETIKRCLKILKEYKNRYQGVKSKLNHGDYSPKHLMFNDRKIVGILDFGEASGNAQVFDLARWQYWRRDNQEFEWLKEGYSNKAVFNEGFEEMVQLIKIDFGLGIFWWYDQQGYLPAVEKAKERLIEDLKFFQ